MSGNLNTDLNPYLNALAEELGISLPPAGLDLRWELADRIAGLIKTDPRKLVNILYRLDIPEQDLATLIGKSGESPEGIADLIIQRQIEKAISRQNNRTASGSAGDWWKD
ncbi:MAG TPA: hypothetical protein VNE41_00360 [Chitinophagaceae bacterium]|nr:hypothetical protein [Chitinophagaceae bacterium]